MSVQSTTTLVVSALRIAASFQERVADIRATLDANTIADRKALADALRPGVAEFYGIALTVKETGRAVIPADHVHAESARTALSKLVRSVQGPVVHHTEPVKVRVARTERAAYEAFLAACGGDVKRVRTVIAACKE
jgi:hypothetical protein